MTVRTYPGLTVNALAERARAGIPPQKAIDIWFEDAHDRYVLDSYAVNPIEEAVFSGNVYIRKYDREESLDFSIFRGCDLLIHASGSQTERLRRCLPKILAANPRMVICLENDACSFAWVDGRVTYGEL